MKYHFNIFLLINILFLMTSCASHDARQKSAALVETDAGFQSHILKAGTFWLQTYQKIKNPHLPYAIYIEGDGFAFRNKRQASPDPTPKRPMLLNLAAMDYRSNVIYIARPCQYVNIAMDNHCNQSYWTTKRMSEEVVNSINVAIQDITRGQPLDLIGFSGGGGIAVLVASRNKHVRSIVTLAGNLDYIRFNEYHHVSRPMIGSLNPIDAAYKNRNIPQLHLSGANDNIVPAFITDHFVQSSHSTCVRQEILPDVSHDTGWYDVWSYVLGTAVTCVHR
jgi:hypothetical protein